MNEFLENGYLHLPKLIETWAFYSFFGEIVESGRGNPDDNQVPGSIGFYKEILFELLFSYL